MASSDQVSEALERILASDKFSTTPRLGRFLRFVVEKSLAGQGAEIKEYLLGTEVFDRGTDFDPRLDPIVRVEARRLRARLDEYYQGPGAGDPLRLTLPKGTYAPIFETPRSEPIPDSHTRRASLRWVLIAGAAVAIAATAYVTRNSFNPPTTAIVVIPQGDDYATGLGEVVSAELARNREVRVVAWPLVTEYMHQQSPAKIGAVVHDLHADAALVINVTRKDDRLRIAALIMRPEKGMKDWVGEYDRGTNDVFAVQREMARTIADEAGRAISKLH